MILSLAHAAAYAILALCYAYPNAVPHWLHQMNPGAPAGCYTVLALLALAHSRCVRRADRAARKVLWSFAATMWTRGCTVCRRGAAWCGRCLSQFVRCLSACGRWFGRRGS